MGRQEENYFHCQRRLTIDCPSTNVSLISLQRCTKVAQENVNEKDAARFWKVSLD